MFSLRFKARAIVPVFIIIVTLAAASSIFLAIHKFRDIPFSWDAAAYATDGLIIARDLKAGDLISFIGDTYRQGWWPFFHSWLLAPVFILFGNTYASARMVSLFCFILYVPVIYWIGLEISQKHGHWIGLITVCLSLSSLPFLVLSAMCMEEIPGLLMTFATFLFYLKALKGQKSGLYVWTSLFMALTLFTKWHHGVFVVAAVSITQLTVNRKMLSRTNLSLFLPFLGMILAWFIYPRHILSFYGHSIFQPKYYRFWSLENWLYYPRSFLHVYHSSVIVAALMGLLFLYSLKRLRESQIRLLAAYVFIGLILMTVKLDNRHRFILPVVPSIWLLGSSQFVEVVSGLKGRLRSRKLKTALISAGTLGLLIISGVTIPKLYRRYPNSLQKYEYFADEKQNQAYEFITQHTGDHDQIAVFGSWGYYNSLKGATIRWNIEAARAKDGRRTAEHKEMANFYFSQLLKKRNRDAYSQFIDFLEHKDVQVVEGHLVSFLKTLNPEAYQEFRKNNPIEPFSDKVLDLASLHETASWLITLCKEGETELNSYAQRFIEKQMIWKKVVGQSFPDLGIDIAIHERQASQRTMTSHAGPGPRSRTDTIFKPLSNPASHR